MIEPTAPESNPEQQDDNQVERKLQQAWMKRIKDEEKSHKDFRDRGRDVDEVFGEDFGNDDELYVPLLWSVVQVEHSGIYSNQPVPDVRPANDEKNPAFRKASDVLERGIAHFVDKQSFDENMHRMIDNYLAIGLGVIRVKLDSEIIDVEVENPPPPPDIQHKMDADDWAAWEQVSTRTEKGIGNQTINWEFVPWDRFGWEPCNSWKHCEWIYFRHRMTGPQIKARFGKVLKASKDPKDKGDPNSWKSKTFDIYEVWDKKDRKQLFLAKNETVPVEINEDPLDLADFFPLPMPLMTNIPTGELVPKADYDYIEAYDKELNRLQERRMALIEQIKATGAHDAGLPELGDIIDQEDGQSLAIPNLAQRVKDVGFEAVMFQLPLEEKVVVLGKLTEQIQVVKAAVDEILGIADIVRGVSNANEGVGTQELKGRWVGIRLSRKRDTVAYTVREMFRIMAQILTSHFTDENLVRLTQVEIDENILAMLRDDMLMDFAIDIETDSTVAKDEFRERETRQEMLGSVGQFASTVLPMVQQGLMPADVSSAILRASLQPYAKYSRALDESMADLQTTMQQLQQMNQQIEQLTQQSQQLEAEKTQWQTVAIQLQNQATSAASEQKQADAQKKRAETAEIVAALPGAEIDPLQRAAEVDKTRMETLKIKDDIMRPDPPKRVQ